MTAPMPMRFFNPVKELCAKVNLDYETVIGTGVTNKTIRDAFINAEVLKPIEEIKSEDKKFIKHKKDFFDTKYGDRVFAESARIGEGGDKGRERYDAGITVEHLCPDDSKVDESALVSNGVGANGSSAEGLFEDRDAFLSILPKSAKWKPGRK
jgi:hypothetical protein